MVQRQELQELLGTHPGPVCEEPLKMKGTHVDCRRNFFEARLLPRIGLQIRDSLGNGVELWRGNGHTTEKRHHEHTEG